MNKIVDIIILRPILHQLIQAGFLAGTEMCGHEILMSTYVLLCCPANRRLRGDLLG
jgi:hypothetical protein